MHKVACARRYTGAMKMPAFVESRVVQFWLLNLLGWVLWGAIGKYFLLVTMLGEDLAPGYGWYVALITLIGFALSVLMHRGYRWVWSRGLWPRVVAFPAISAAAAYAWISARHELFSAWFENEKSMQEWEARLDQAAELYQKVSFVDGFGSAWVVMIGWAALYYAARSARLFASVRESALKAEAMAHESQLKMLRYQLNPHFLFNTLNAISTLILEKDTRQANEMVMGLSSFLRYSIDNDPMQRSNLQREIDVLKLYLDIERVRFEERLRVEYDVSDDAAGALVPNMLLQPLVENAIKYAIAPSEQGGTIRIRARCDDGSVVVTVCDDGPGIQHKTAPNGRQGVGLRNTRERLQSLYGNNQSVTLIPLTPRGLCVEIRIPLQLEGEQ